MGSEAQLLYEDKLVVIKEDSLILKSYYFPSMSPKLILASLLTGKWRVHGTGDFRTWFPFDPSRTKRDKIFLIYYKNKWMRSAFTVEDSQRVEDILKKKGLLS